MNNSIALVANILKVPIIMYVKIVRTFSIFWIHSFLLFENFHYLMFSFLLNFLKFLNYFKQFRMGTFYFRCPRFYHLSIVVYIATRPIIFDIKNTLNPPQNGNLKIIFSLQSQQYNFHLLVNFH